MPNSELNGSVVSGPEREGAVEGRLTPSLLPQLREVLFSSLVTSFGLDALVFDNPWLPGRDEAGGHVDTLHNVAESQKNGGKPVFKKKKHQDAYDARGTYESSAYHDNNGLYGERKRHYDQLRDRSELISGYTGENISEYNLEHIVSGRDVHNDGRFALSGVDRVEVASQNSNFTPIEETENKRKGPKTADEYIKLRERDIKNSQNAINKIQEKIKNGTATEKNIASIELLKKEIEIAEKVKYYLVKEKDRNARQEMAKAHSIYYRSRDFIGTTSAYAIIAGGKMAAKQVLGLVLMELSVAVQEELPTILQHWREAPDWQTKLDPRPYLERVAAVLSAAWEQIKAKAGHIWGEAKSGFAAGLLSEIVTTIINIFTGTAKSIMRLLRNFWAGIVNSLKILIFNPDNLGAEEKLGASIYRWPNKVWNDSLPWEIGSGRCVNRGFSGYRIT